MKCWAWEYFLTSVASRAIRLRARGWEALSGPAAGTGKGPPAAAPRSAPAVVKVNLRREMTFLEFMAESWL